MGRKFIATGMDNITGQFGIINKEDSLVVPSVLCSSGTPSLIMGSSGVLGTGASASIIGNNLAGIITFTTAGIVVLATGKILTMTFADGLTFPNGFSINFSGAANVNFNSIFNRLFVNPISTGVELHIGTSPLALGTTYVGHYQIVGF